MKIGISKVFEFSDITKLMEKQDCNRIPAGISRDKCRTWTSYGMKANGSFGSGHPTGNPDPNLKPSGND